MAKYFPSPSSFHTGHTPQPFTHSLTALTAAVPRPSGERNHAAFFFYTINHIAVHHFINSSLLIRPSSLRETMQHYCFIITILLFLIVSPTTDSSAVLCPSESCRFSSFIIHLLPALFPVTQRSTLQLSLASERLFFLYF